MIKAVIFDMDGVLIDSENHWQRNEQEVFRELGIELTDELLTQTRGLTTLEMVKHWTSRFKIDSISPEKLMDRYDERMMGIMQDQVPLMEGAIDSIHFFKTKGIPLALASCTIQKLIDAALKKHNLGEYFDVVISAGRNMQGKPHPEIYLKTAELMKTDPTCCLAIEDSFFGLISAKAARMKVLSLPDPSEFDQPRFGAADLKIRSLKEINEELYNKLQ